MPDVSVIIPTHNRSRLLALTIRSALRQRDVDLEVITVDDGSRDDTPELLRQMGDPRIRGLRHESAQGMNAARNHGIEEARGRWVAFLDDDDLWSPEKLALQLEALRESNRIWAYTGLVEISIDNKVFAARAPVTPEEVVASLTWANKVPGPSSVIVEKDYLPRPPFDLRLRHSGDWDLWIRLARRGPPAGVAQPLLAYRIHPGNDSLDMEGFLKEVDEIEKRYGGSVDRGSYIRYFGDLSLNIGWHRAALSYYRQAASVPRSHYRRIDFASDVWTLLWSAFRMKAEAVGIRLPNVRSANDPYRAWKEEARTWVDELVRDEQGWRSPA